MNDPVELKARFVAASRQVPCTLPWTSMEENTIIGKYKTCCWTDYRFGYMDKTDDGDLMDLWRGPAGVRLRDAMGRGALGEVCPPHCVIPSVQAALDYVDFMDYDPAEYATFPEAFRQNREKVVRSLEQRTADPDTYPLRMKFHPSNICNLRCPMCLREGHETVRELPQKYIERIFRVLPYLEEVTIYGGEFLACPTTRRIVLGEEMASHPQLHYSVTSNGTLLSEANLNKLAHLRFGKIIISLDSHTQKTYEAIRIGAKHKTTMANVERLARWRDQGKLRVNRLMAAFVIMAVNHREITGFLDMCHDLGYRPYYIMVDNSDELDDMQEQVLESIDRGLERAKELRDRLAQVQLKLMKKKLPLAGKEYLPQKAQAGRQ